TQSVRTLDTELPAHARSTERIRVAYDERHEADALPVREWRDLAATKLDLPSDGHVGEHRSETRRDAHERAASGWHDRPRRRRDHGTWLDRRHLVQQQHHRRPRELRHGPADTAARAELRVDRRERAELGD